MKSVCKAERKYAFIRTFSLTDLLIALGMGAIIGSITGIVGGVVGVICIFSGWATTKLFKKETKPNED